MECFSYADDDVYLAEEDLRKEYVLSDDGLIYAGWSRRFGPNPARWNFGQVCWLNILSIENLWAFRKTHKQMGIFYPMNKAASFAQLLTFFY